MSPAPFVISLWASIGVCTLITLGFVLSLYIWNIIDGHRPRQRDELDVVLRRFVSVTAVCVVVPLMLNYLVTWNTACPIHFFESIGLFPLRAIIASLHALILTAVLYIGPIAQNTIDYCDRLLCIMFETKQQNRCYF
jgi:hypothetical protein